MHGWWRTRLSACLQLHGDMCQFARAQNPTEDRVFDQRSAVYRAVDIAVRISTITKACCLMATVLSNDAIRFDLPLKCLKLIFKTVKTAARLEIESLKIPMHLPRLIK